jgi:hypothetical protein
MAARASKSDHEILAELAALAPLNEATPRQKRCFGNTQLCISHLRKFQPSAS